MELFDLFISKAHLLYKCLEKIKIFVTKHIVNQGRSYAFYKKVIFNKLGYNRRDTIPSSFILWKSAHLSPEKVTQEIRDFNCKRSFCFWIVSFSFLCIIDAFSIFTHFEVTHIVSFSHLHSRTFLHHSHILLFFQVVIKPDILMNRNIFSLGIISPLIYIFC